MIGTLNETMGHIENDKSKHKQGNKHKFLK